MLVCFVKNKLLNCALFKLTVESDSDAWFIVEPKPSKETGVGDELKLHKLVKCFMQAVSMCWSLNFLYLSFEPHRI